MNGLNKLTLGGVLFTSAIAFGGGSHSGYEQMAEYPAIHGYGINTLCLADGGNTLKTISPVEFCADDASTPELDSSICHKPIYQTVSFARETAIEVCAKVAYDGEGAAQCVENKHLPAPKTWSVPILEIVPHDSNCQDECGATTQQVGTVPFDIVDCAN